MTATTVTRRCGQPRTLAYGDLIDPENFTAVLGRVSEYAFKNKYLNMWTSSVQAWLPHGAWAKCRSDEGFTPGELGVVLGFDGSRSGDTTALVAVTVEAEPQIKVIGLWEKPQDQAEWRVPRAEVKDTIRQACKDYDVREIAADELHLAGRTRRTDGRRSAGGCVPAERQPDAAWDPAFL